MIQKHDIRFAYLYSGLSILIGPGILILGNKLFPARLACFDIEPNLPHQDVIVQYRNQQILETTIALLMIALGALLIRTLFLRAKTTKPKALKAEVAIILIAMMIFGYILIVLFAELVTKCVTG
jgi:hypothetical protein